MSRLISDILNAPEPHFSHTIHRLEKSTGSKGHDVRLISDINVAKRRVLDSLKLDQNDTTAKEIYFALRHKAHDVNQELESAIGVNGDDSPEVMVDKVTKFIDSLSLSREVWVIKHSVIKRLLKSAPPKKTLKSLGFRSIDSVLKRNNACELLTLAAQIENTEWLNKFRLQYKKFKITDFAATSSSIFVINSSKLDKLRTSDYSNSKIVVPNYETGSILVAPSEKRFNLDTLAITITILQTLYELKVYSAFFKLVSVNEKFGIKLLEALQNGLSSKITEKEIGWKVLQKHFNHNDNSFEPLEQPHFQKEDVSLEEPLKILINIVPSFEFWHGKEYVYFGHDNKPVSLHILDVVTNASNEFSYEDSVNPYLRQQLWEQLLLRYMQHEEIRQEVLNRYTG